MAPSDDMFATLSLMFPNRVRAQFEDGQLKGLAGPYELGLLELIGECVSRSHPQHHQFVDSGSGSGSIAIIRRIVPVPAHPDIVVRYLHFAHSEAAPCCTLALATGPADLVDQIATTQCEQLPFTRRELKLTIDLAAGKSLQDIARSEGISINTIRNQLKSAMRATSTHSQAHLTSIVRDWLS